jgi:ABC-type branched-subunit amino acid transport system ATPase component
MKLRLDREPCSVSQTGTEVRPPLGARTSAIEVSHLTKNFGGRVAVADVSFTVARGEVFGFLGPNGAGKTTTVRILGTLISARATDTRVAQQLSTLGSLPPVALAALMSFQVISPTFTLAAALAGALLAIDCGACLLVARLFDRERLVTGRQH